MLAPVPRIANIARATAVQNDLPRLRHSALSFSSSEYVPGFSVMITPCRVNSEICCVVQLSVRYDQEGKNISSYLMSTWVYTAHCFSLKVRNHSWRQSV